MLNLFLEFLKIGIFAIGGGYATIPFLFRLSEIYPWFSNIELEDMIAISNITPGPVGINMATYSGFKAYGALGSLVSTLGIILGPFIITLIAIYFIDKFKKSQFIKSLFEGLRPTSCALLIFVALELCKKNFFNANGNADFGAIILCIMLFAIYPHVKKHPSLIIFIGAILGIILKFFLQK